MNPIISANIRVRNPDFFKVGQYSVVDDYSYFSTKINIGFCSHIAANCTVGGGVKYTFSLGDFSSVSSGVRIWCTSDDFVNDLVTIMPVGVKSMKQCLMEGDVKVGNFTAIGTNSVILPDNEIPEGTVIGALSFVPYKFKMEPWSVYAGNPIKKIGLRNREQVLAQADMLYKALKGQAA